MVHPRPRAGRRRAAALLTTAGVALSAAAVAGGGGGVASASSHREAPLTAADPQHDNTDVYAFTSPDRPDTVTLISNWIPFQEPNGGPNFYPWAAGSRYNINIDNDGDGEADLTYRYTFRNIDRRGTAGDGGTFLYNNGVVDSLDDPNLLFKQVYDLDLVEGGKKATRLVSGATSAPSNVGPASMPDYDKLRSQAIAGVKGGGRTVATQAADPFFLDLRVFDLLYGGDLSETGQNTLKGYNVNSIALQVPKSALAARGNAEANPVIGIWSTTEKRSMQLSSGKGPKAVGRYVQVSRLGNPLVNEVVIPAHLKDTFNRTTPDRDHTLAPVVAKVLKPEVPQLIEAIYGLKAPATPRNDLAEIFLTGLCKACGPVQVDLNSQMLNRDGLKGADFVPSEMLRLNMSVAPAAKPNRLGVLGGDLAGFPNGRRLTDDVVDIEVRALEGAVAPDPNALATSFSDGVNTPGKAPSGTFPYLPLPYNQAVNTQ